MADEQEYLEFAAALLYGAAQAMISAGARPTTALRVAAAVVVREGLGDEALRDLGISKASLSRWRTEARELLAEEPPDEVVARYQALVEQQARAST